MSFEIVNMGDHSRFRNIKTGSETVYCLFLYKFASDWQIAEYLSISTIEYQNILCQNGGILDSLLNEVFFNSLEDIQNAISSLEPYLIMAKLNK